MPLLDHFHPPLHPGRRWEAFHSRWAKAIADVLNADLLPSQYYAEVQTHAGTRIEVDVATLKRDELKLSPRPNGPGLATLPARVWTAPSPTFSLPATAPETFEVKIFGNEPGGLELVGALELISPGN
jgi:hypothetical protein